jgi:hypothetical protein
MATLDDMMKIAVCSGFTRLLIAAKLRRAFAFFIRLLHHRGNLPLIVMGPRRGHQIGLDFYWQTS